MTKKTIAITISLLALLAVVAFNMAKNFGSKSNFESVSETGGSSSQGDHPRLVASRTFGTDSQNRSQGSVSGESTTKSRTTVIGPNKVDLEHASRKELVEHIVNTQKGDFDSVRHFLASAMEELSAQLGEEMGDEAKDEEEQELLNNIKKATEEALSDLEKNIAESYDKNFTPEELRELIALQDDPDFQALRESSRIEDPEEMRTEYPQFLDSLKENPLSEERKALLNQMVEDSNLEEIFDKMNESFKDPSMPDSGTADPEMLAEMKRQREEFKQQSFENLAFKFRKFDDSVVKGVSRVMNTPIMQKNQRVQRDMLPSAMKKTMETLTSVIGPE